MYLKLVRKMHDRFNIPLQALTDYEFALFRASAMHEEIVEFERAVLRDNPNEALDALVDLAVFLFGTADLLGIPQYAFQEAYSRVMQANLTKVVAETGDHKRGWQKDLIKPPGWAAPTFEGIFPETHAPLVREIRRLQEFLSTWKLTPKTSPSIYALIENAKRALDEPDTNQHRAILTRTSEVR